MGRVLGVRRFFRRTDNVKDSVSDEDFVMALMQGGLLLEREMKVNIKEQGLIDTGNLRDKTTADPDPDLGPRSVSVGPKGVPYAAIHEFGGKIPITDKMRGFAWHMFAETGEGMWKGLALTKKTHITVPARPYVRPALDEHGDDAVNVAGRALAELIKRAAS